MSSVSGQTTFCTSGVALAEAGIGVNVDDMCKLVNGSPINTGDVFIVDQWIIQAENEINILSRYDWTTAFNGLPDATKNFLRGAAAEYAGSKCIKYDMSGYSSRAEAEDNANLLRENYLRKLGIIKDKKNQKFLTDVSTGTV